MFFVLSKTIGYLLLPTNLLIGIGLVGAMLMFTRFAALGRKLVIAVGLLLVIACVNVTNLLLSRAMASSGDAAVRLALGASRGHLMRQSLAEALVLTLTGAVCGALGARLALGWLASMVQADLPPWFDVRFDPVVLLWTAAIAMVTAAAVASADTQPTCPVWVEGGVWSPPAPTGAGAGVLAGPWETVAPGDGTAVGSAVPVDARAVVPVGGANTSLTASAPPPVNS